MNDNEKLGITVDEAAKLLGIGKNLRIKLENYNMFLKHICQK